MLTDPTPSVAHDAENRIVLLVDSAILLLERRLEMQSTTAQLEVTYLRTTSLKPDPRNPRVHSDKQVRQIAQSIESFGFNVPLLIDDQQKVIAGHGRLLAARKMGWDTVPAIKLSHLTESQRMAFLIADNRLTENSSWDERMLGEQLKILSELELDFDLEAIGFEVPEIDLLIDGLNTVPEADPDDRLPEISESAVTVSGDLWQLGKHRVLCGNSLVAASYERLMDGAKADLVITDPPYNVVIDGHATGNRLDSPPRVRDGIGRDELDRVYRLSPQGDARSSGP